MAMRRLFLVAVLAVLVIAGWLLARDGTDAPRPPLVLAAASMQVALDEAADAWAARGNARPVLSYAASSALARQAIAGARADLLITADQDWMDQAERAGALLAGTRADLLGNRIVLIAPRASTATIALTPDAPLAALIGDDRMAMADPDAVPAGRYGKAALERLGLWEAVAPRVVRAENVRAALALVERGAVGFGIVYATDARSSDRVRVVATFDEALHPPIRYPIARLARGDSPDGERLRLFLLSPDARAIFARHGFTTS